MLRLVVNAPLGYHVCITSTHAFVLGDENTIMQHLIKVYVLLFTHRLSVLEYLRNHFFYSLKTPENIDCLIL